MLRSNRGFSLVELVVVIIIGTIMTSIVIRGFGSARAGNSVRAAEQNFRALHARARAYAIERGEETQLIVDPNTEEVLVLDAAGDTVDMMDFFETLGVDLGSPSGTLRLTFTPRGYADLDKNNFSSLAEITFGQEAEVRSVAMLPIGQLRNP